jgi:hypothetical protein
VAGMGQAGGTVAGCISRLHVAYRVPPRHIRALHYDRRRSAPSGPGWVYEIKHDGFRLIPRRDVAVVRLITATATIGRGPLPRTAIAFCGPA